MGTHVFLTDFGLSKDITGQAMGLSRSNITRTGTTLGTPAYMSPEQARGEFSALTTASDVWALGCVLYECLAGRKAFEGESPAAVIGAVLTATPAFPAGVPAGVAEVVRACLRRDAGARHPAADVLRDDLARVARGETPLRRALAGRRRGGRAWLGAATVSVLAVAGWRMAGGRPPQPTDGIAPADTDVTALAAGAWRRRRTDLEGAIADLSRACAARAERADWWVQLGELHWWRGDTALAVAAWGQVAPDAAEYARAQWLTGLSQLLSEIEGSGNPDGRELAEQAWRRAAIGGGEAAAWARAGLALQAGSAAEALAALPDTVSGEAALLRSLVLGAVPGTPNETRLRAYDRALEDGRPWCGVYVNRSVLRQEMGDLAGALLDAERAVQLQPRLQLAWSRLGAARSLTGDHGGADAAYAQAIAFDPERADGWYDRGVAALRAGNAAHALAHFSKALVLDPTHARALANRGTVRAKVGDAEGALHDATQALALDPTLLPPRALRAQVFEQLGDWAAVRAECDELVRRAPNDLEFRRLRGHAALALGDLALARTDLDAVIGGSDASALVYHDRAMARVRLGDHDGAAADWETAIRLDPQMVTAMMNLALVHHKAGRDPEARRWYDRALELAPTFVECWSKRGELHYQHHRLALARADLDRVLELDPAHARGRLFRGLVAFETEDWGGACTHLGQAAQNMPDDLEVWRLLSAATYNARRWQACVEAVERFTQLAPADDPDLRKLQAHAQAAAARAREPDVRDR